LPGPTPVPLGGYPPPPPSFAAVREVKEETGLEVEPGEVIGERVHPKTGRTMIYVAARPVRSEDLAVFVGEERELAEVRWVSLAEADELMAAYGMFEPVHEHLAREIGEG
jgi:8-oxo-dGTP diphosphatase